MEKPGTHPDCVHCRFMIRQRNGEYRCRQHDMTLHSPVSLFCKQLAPKDEQDADYQHWFTETVKAEELEPNTLYTWVETRTRGIEDEIVLHVDAALIAPLTAYLTWSAGTFWRVLRGVRHTKRDEYRQHGYEIIE